MCRQFFVGWAPRAHETLRHVIGWWEEAAHPATMPGMGSKLRRPHRLNRPRQALPFTQRNLRARRVECAE